MAEVYCPMKGVRKLLILNNYNHDIVGVEISSKKFITGELVEFGKDIVIIYDGKQLYYIPILHIQCIKKCTNSDLEGFQTPQTVSFINEDDSISYRKILNNAKGYFVEIYVTGRQSIHGYITNILNNYFVFYSPVYKTMFIPLNHLKWLIPYELNQTPYSLSNYSLPVNPEKVTLARTFEEQVKKYIGKIVVFDIGEDPNKIGKLQSFENNVVEIVTGREETVYWNFQHLKVFHTTE